MKGENKKVHKQVEYLNELPNVLKSKATFKTVDDLKDVNILLGLIKSNALIRIGQNMQLMTAKDGFSSWEKLNQAY